MSDLQPMSAYSMFSTHLFATSVRVLYSLSSILEPCGLGSCQQHFGVVYELALRMQHMSGLGCRHTLGTACMMVCKLAWDHVMAVEPLSTPHQPGWLELV